MIPPEGLWVVKRVDNGRVLANPASFKEAKEIAIRYAKEHNTDVKFYKIATEYFVEWVED